MVGLFTPLRTSSLGNTDTSNCDLAVACAVWLALYKDIANTDRRFGCWSEISLEWGIVSPHRRQLLAGNSWIFSRWEYRISARGTDWRFCDR